MVQKVMDGAASTADFKTLMDTLAEATGDLKELERHRPMFSKASHDSPQGFAGVVAQALRYTPKDRDPVGAIHAAVAAGQHRDGSASRTNAKPLAWVVHVESADGVTPYRKRTLEEAAAFVKELENIKWISEPDEGTRELFVELLDEKPSEVDEAAEL